MGHIWDILGIYCSYNGDMLGIHWDMMEVESGYSEIFLWGTEDSNMIVPCVAFHKNGVHLQQMKDMKLPTVLRNILRDIM